ncbi:MAG: alkyl hydroperoxide reductase [Blastopirellula sp.]|nr:MAG: alkyl hydroperoxide reductase [Blastopirellula sp.]
MSLISFVHVQSYSSISKLFVICCLLLIVNRVEAEEKVAVEKAPEDTLVELSDEKKPAKEPTSLEEAEVLAGHSYHGDVFNEGPRQKAYLMGGTGDVHFEITTKSEEAQKFFDQGIGQLHGFWYLEAERSFRHAASIDPDCAMMYWGAAFANLKNIERAKGFIKEAVNRTPKASPREVLYIETLDKYIHTPKDKKKERNEAYTKSLEALILKYPDDLEAKAFLALHLYDSRSGSTSYFAVNALMEDILAENPMHPVHHFRIHLWDYKNPEFAVPSASLCGQSAPNIAHMWHMPGHIFSRLKQYDNAVWQQEASARVDHANMIKDRLMPDEIHNFAHNNEWLIRNLIFIGRVHDAVDLAKNMTELPRHPRFNTLSKRGSARYGRQRLIQVLEGYRLWDEVLALKDTPYLAPTKVDAEQVKRLRLLGMASYETKDFDEAAKYLAELEQRLASVLADQADAAKKALEAAKKAKKNKKDTDKAVADAKKKLSAKVKAITGAVNTVKGYEALSRNEYLEAFTVLKKAGGADRLLMMDLHWLTGESEKAEKAYRDYIKSHKNEVLPRARFVHLLWRVDQRDKAIKEFQELAKISAEVDLDIRVFADLAPIAKAAGAEADWRVEKKLTIDLSTRPELSSLGPFRWQPSKAPSWDLVNETGDKVSSTQWEGKPHLVIFYLGYSCLHCAEQLQAFAPKVKEFNDIGLDVVAISTDDQAGLLKSIEAYTEEKMPIKLVSDGPLEVFKKFRVFDDFEKQPLHGTFVIDADGSVLWQDIGYEPFMDPDFVIEEAVRLMEQRKVLSTSSE